MSVATAASVDGQQTASESGIDLAGRTVYVPGAGLSVLGRVTNDQVQTVFGTHDVAAVVLLPKPGEWIEDDDGSGPGMRGCWLGGLANADGSLTVLLAARGLVHEIVVDPARVDARRVVRDEGTQQAGLLEALTAEAQLHAETSVNTPSGVTGSRPTCTNRRTSGTTAQTSTTSWRSTGSPVAHATTRCG